MTIFYTIIITVYYQSFPLQRRSDNCYIIFFNNKGHPFSAVCLTVLMIFLSYMTFGYILSGQTLYFRNSYLFMNCLSFCTIF